MSARNLTDGFGASRREDGASVLQHALARESAANLGRLGSAVARALAKLKEAPAAAREDAEYACAEAVWMYFVQRESCGQMRHDWAIEAYEIPKAVLAKVGARRPAPDAT